MAAARLYALREEFPVRVRFRAFPLEIINRRPTPKHIVDQEWPLITVQERRAPCRAWEGDGYPYTTLPAFQAYYCAELQGLERAQEFDLRIRKGFFYERRSIFARHVLLEIAKEAGLDVDAFRRELDSGRHEGRIMEDYEEGFVKHPVQGSPTLVTPAGEHFFNPAASEKRIQEGRLTEVHPPPCYGDDCLEVYRKILRRAIETAPPFTPPPAP